MSLLVAMLTGTAAAADPLAAIDELSEGDDAQTTVAAGTRCPLMAVFEITVFNTATQVATEYSIDAGTEAEAVASLGRELDSRTACTLTFEHTSFFCGHPRCPAAPAHP